MILKKIASLFLGVALIITSCINQNREVENFPNNPCINGHDTTFHISFSKDTNFQDFFRLLDFIESKTDFSRYNKYNAKTKIVTNKNQNIVLQKILCGEKFEKSPVESTHLDSICWIESELTSKKPEKGTKNYFSHFGLIQINCINEVEKEKALALIRNIGWGDPLMKWNEYKVVSGKRKIYILDISDATFQDYDDKYALFIQKEWIDKNKAD